jgi:hypothetical protein
MMNAKDFGVMVVATDIITVVIMALQYHDIAMRRPWIYDVLRPSNIVRGIIKSCNVVMIYSVTLEND